MLNVNLHAFNSVVHRGIINGTGRVFGLRRIDTPGIKILGFQICRPETEYVVTFGDVTLENGKIIYNSGERNITKTEFDRLRIGDIVEIQFIITQHFTGGPTTLYASNFTCIERQEALTLS